VPSAQNIRQRRRDVWRLRRQRNLAALSSLSFSTPESQRPSKLVRKANHLGCGIFDDQVALELNGTVKSFAFEPKQFNAKGRKEPLNVITGFLPQ